MISLSKTQLRKVINKFHKNMNRSHYLKWDLGYGFSVRYFFNFDNKPEYNGKYVLKIHDYKYYHILTTAEAIAQIQMFSESIEPTEYFSVKERKKYRRAIIDHSKPISQFILE